MAVHELKIWPEYFEAVTLEDKKFEVRKNDRDFQVGDTLILREWVTLTGQYTGRYVNAIVTYILSDKPFVPEGYVIMSIDLT